MHVKIRSPCIWEASNRPMFIRSVWLDNEGVRHFILDRESSPQRRPELKPSRRVYAQKSLPYSLEESMESLQLIGSSEVPRVQVKEPRVGKACRHEASVDYFTLKKHLGGRHNVRRDSLWPQEVRVEEEGENKEKEGQKLSKSPERVVPDNQLTERVLQWLDKSGQATMIKEDEKIPPKPAETRIRPKTTGPTRKSDAIHHLELTFDDDDFTPSPYPSSKPFEGRCKSARFADFFPTTYKYSRKFLSFVSSRKKSAPPSFSESTPTAAAATVTLSNLSLPPSSATPTQSPPQTKSESNNGNETNNQAAAINQATRQKSTTTSRRRPPLLRRKDTLMENQYRTIIQRHILEHSCNKLQAKQQLHVFIPKLPEKRERLEVPAGGEEAPGSPSCLSTVFSEVSKR